MIATERALTRTYCRSVVIVGAGFCGATLATQLLRARSTGATHITLVEQRAQFARGEAYAEHEFPYLLNVPASRMSADGGDPQQFLEFARHHTGTQAAFVNGGDFLPRSLYGDYLQSLLSNAERAAAPQVTLSRVNGQVQRLVPLPQGDLRIELASGTHLFADDVVLATGNPPPTALPGTEFLRDHAGYIDSPWTLPHSGAWRNVLIVGTGLSMADVFMRLHSQPSPPRMHALSRRGLLPAAQSDFPATALRGASEQVLACTDSLRALTRTVRKLITTGDHLGGDWRRVANLLRTLTPTIWDSLPPAERQRFVRHVQPYWDAHRHRLPPQVAEQIAHAQRKGRLTVHAGRIQSLQPVGKQLKVSWHRRGYRDDGPKELTVDAVINATGPSHCLSTTRNPLLRSLYDSGLIAADCAALGIKTGANYQVVGADGRTNNNIFYLGPMLRATYWEATAVAELRQHAAQLATVLANRTRQWSAR